MLAFLWVPDWFWHPLRNGDGYNTWSGWIGDLGLLTILTAFLAGFVTWLRHHNCHVHRCWRLSWHPHPGHGHPVCKHHHPEHRQIRHGPVS